MHSTSVLIGVLPLIIFVILDSFLGPRKALISAMILAFAEVGFTLYQFGELDEVSIFSLLTVLVLAYLSLKTQSNKYILFQPTIVGVVLAGSLLISYLIGKPLFPVMAEKYKIMFPPEMQTQFALPQFKNLLHSLTWTVGLAILAHATLMAYAALRLNKWWWIAIRAVGFYVFLFLGAIAAGLINRT